MCVIILVTGLVGPFAFAIRRPKSPNLFWKQVEKGGRIIANPLDRQSSCKPVVYDLSGDIVWDLLDQGVIFRIVAPGAGIIAR